MYIVQQSLYI